MTTTSNGAYFLGLAYSDGFITGKLGNKYYTFGITLKRLDEQILNDISNFIGGYVKIKNKNGYETANYLNCSIKFVEYLITLGIIPNKTYENNSFVFDNIRDDLKWHFVRGFFDGDGSVGRYGNRFQMSFVGLNRKLLVSISNFINEKTGSNASVIEDGKHYRLIYSGNVLVSHIRDFLYQNQELCLNRKKIIFDECFHKDDFRGINNSRHKLDNEKVSAIRNSSLSYSKLADIYHVSRSCIAGVKSFKTWKDV